jgi:hypothetical protein
MTITHKTKGIIRHALTLPATLLLCWLFVAQQWVYFHKIQSLARIIIMTFAAFVLACLVEWWQGTKGANRTPAEKKDMYNDIAVSTLSGLMGVLITELFIL